ncbi:MAG: hypothetical protein ACKOE6_03740, partial [Flammeovirgaceae bacterium]
MRKLITILAILTTGYSGIAQCDVKGILTNPTAPVNTERPAKTNTFFDWRTQYYLVNSASINATQIESPYYQGYQNLNVESLFTEKDMKPENGWELIGFDMGFNEDGSPKNPK